LIPGIFITGTGTDVGKTLVTAGVLRWLRGRSSAAHSSAAMVMKPVQTGCQLCADGQMIVPDIDFVLRAAEVAVDEETLSHLSPYRFQAACSPHLAARMAGTRIEIDRILASAKWLASRHQRLVVEGAGGVAVPLNECQTMLDLAWELGMPVLLVGHSGLGTINHVLLSLEAIRRRGCKVLGVMLNDIRPVAGADEYIHEDNVRAIESFGKVRVTRIPFLSEPPGEPPEMGRLDASLEHCDFLKEYPL
jgi:dethiobiotin synthase